MCVNIYIYIYVYIYAYMNRPLLPYEQASFAICALRLLDEAADGVVLDHV